MVASVSDGVPVSLDLAGGEMPPLWDIYSDNRFVTQHCIADRRKERRDITSGLIVRKRKCIDWTWSILLVQMFVPASSCDVDIRRKMLLLSLLLWPLLRKLERNLTLKE